MAIKKLTKRKPSGRKLKTRKALTKKRASKQKLSRKRRTSTKEVTTSGKSASSRRTYKRTRRNISRKSKNRVPRKRRRKVRQGSIKRKVRQNIEDFSKKPHESVVLNEKDAAKPNGSPVVFVTTPKGLAVSCPVDPADGQGRIFIGNKDGDVLLVESHFDGKTKQDATSSPAADICSTADMNSTAKDDTSESYEIIDMPSRDDVVNERAMNRNHQKSGLIKRSPTASDSKIQFIPRIIKCPNDAGELRIGEERHGKDEPTVHSYN